MWDPEEDLFRCAISKNHHCNLRLLAFVFPAPSRKKDNDRGTSQDRIQSDEMATKDQRRKPGGSGVEESNIRNGSI